MAWATPLSIKRVVGAVRDKFPELQISLHLHDTRGMGIANAYAGMGTTAEVVARQFGITREEQDAFALRSHQRAIAAIEGIDGVADLFLGQTAHFDDHAHEVLQIGVERLRRVFAHGHRRLLVICKSRHCIIRNGQ